MEAKSSMCLLKLLYPDGLAPSLVLVVFLLNSTCSLLSYFQTMFPPQSLGQLNSGCIGQSGLRTVWGEGRSEREEIPSPVEALVPQPLNGHNTFVSLQGQTAQDLK